MGTVKVDNLVNQSEDQDSGIDLSTNDQVLVKTANATRVTVTDAATTVANTLTASTGITVSDGDIAMANGHGISFAATSDTGGMTSELLDDYEEGTFSVAEQNGAGVGVSLSEAQYTKIGRMVFIYVDLAIGSNSAGGVVNFQSLPFTPSSNKSQKFDTYTNATNNPIAFAIGNAIATVKANATANLFYSDLSGKFLRINGQYQID